MIAFPRSSEDETPGRPTVKWRMLRFVFRHIVNLSLVVLIGAFIVIVLAPYMVVNVPSGHVGVLWKRFSGGTALDPRLLRDEGFTLILPWNKLFLYDLRIQSASQTYNAISSDGVNVTATLNIRFRLRREFIPQLHQAIGPDYISLLGPEIASRMREIVSHYSAEQVYSTQRETIQEGIKSRVIEALGERFLERDGGVSYHIPIRDVGELYDTLLQEIKLPAEVVAAINRKAEQYYVAQEYVFRVERERREAERKKIEAEGIRDFQATVGQGISDSYLRLRGIEATLELAKSNNAKVVIIGSGKDGLPIILGNDGAGPAAPAGAQPGALRSGAAAPAAGTGSDSGAGPGTNAQAPAGSAPAAKSKSDERTQLLPSGLDDLIARLWNRQPAEAQKGEGAQP